MTDDQQIPAGGIKGFLDFANEIERAAFDRNPDLASFLSEIHESFKKVLFQENMKAPPLPSLLMMNSHASFLGAVRTAFSGQSPPVFMILRGSLESAAYALLARDKENEKAYLARDRNKRTCRESFTMAKAVSKLRRIDPNLGTFFKEHYEAQIDFGAHPNAKSVVNHLSLSKRNDGMTGMTLTILHDPGSGSITQTLMACLETGIALLWICPHVLSEQDAAAECHKKGTELHDAKERWVEKNHPPASTISNGFYQS